MFWGPENVGSLFLTVDWKSVEWNSAEWKEAIFVIEKIWKK